MADPNFASMSAAELGQKVKAKYPGEYDHLQDEELAHKVIAKYPEYGDVVRPSGVTKPNIDMQPESTPADYAKSAIRMGVNAFTGTPGAVSTKEMSGQPGAGDLAAQGASELGTQGKRLRGALDIANAGMDIATPALGPAALESPVAVGRTVLGGVAGQTGALKAANALGASPDVAEAAGDLGGLAGGVIAAPGVASGAVRLAARTGEAAANQKLIPLRAIANLGTPADEAAALKVKLPGRDAGLGQTPEFPGAKLPARPDAKFLKQNIATPMQEGSSAFPAVKTPSGLNTENAAHSNSFFEQVKSEHPEMSVSQQLMEAAKRENAPAKGIPGKPTVIPSPSSEAYKSSAPPLEARIPGPEEDMTALLSKSVDQVKAPVYDDETVAAAAKGLEEQGFDPKDIQQLLQKMGLGPKTGMNVDEVFSQYPPGDAVQPFAKERAAAIEAQGPEADAIKSKLTKLRGVKVPPSPAMTPEEIKARLLKFQR